MSKLALAIDRIQAAIQRGDAFLWRVTEAAGDSVRLADLMAEAIEMNRDARGLEVVGLDGRSRICMEEMQSFYCLDAARAAYLVARGSNRA